MSIHELNAECMKMTGEQVSEKMLADIEKYYHKYFFGEDEPFYKNSFKMLGATINEQFDDIEVKMIYCNCVEKRFLKIDELYKP
jgi:hypothetical protein